ncbi:MAG: hypothetical protein IJ455_08200 [Agathobacter sp.]|nr:hypothetical protein [Agathobacter sp.]
MAKRRLVDEGIYFIKAAIVFAICMVVAVALSSILSGVLQEREQQMIEIGQIPSDAVLELVGMQEIQVFPPQVEIFFLLLMISNLLPLGAIIGHSVHSMRYSFEQGAFAFYYVQVMERWMYYGLTLLRILISSMLTWGIYIVEVILASGFVSRDLGAEIGEAVLAVLGTMARRGSGIVVLMVALGVLYGVCQYYRLHGADYGLFLIGLSFILGNLYKIPQLIGYKQIEEMVNAQMTMKVVYYMKQLRFLCPFSWLNPFNIQHNILNESVIWGYGLVAVVILVVAGIIFWKRDWQEL